ncbi:MAG: 2-oxoacid:acceptor oxidoreductase subunit alpha [Thermodesulfovibrionales bacterium]|nr:2-oxoacid:acceptor oxidoreductase subunit alpha [Thermodesulfovibrionales bacterium]
MDYTLKIGGEAGQGIQTIGDTLAKVFSRYGFHLFSHQDYESRIRGGHNYYQIRISDRPIGASKRTIDILIAMDKESIYLYEKDLSEIGQIVYDSSVVKEKYDSPHFLNLPFMNFSMEISKSKIMANSVVMGGVLGMLGMELDILNDLIEDTFKTKGSDVIALNKKAVHKGYEYALGNCLRCSFLVPSLNKKLMLISGNESIAFGAIASGLKFYSAYPMTPSTGIMNFIATKASEYGIIIEQAEDEISAINMAIGASFGGVRAMTGTSGGGFALMTEGLSLAGMTETPLVIVLAQRPGPAPGFPTRTEQGDLNFALYTAHGEFPRVVFAPGTPEQAFFLTNKAFDLAEKYQIQVIILTDQYLADSQWTYEEFDLAKLRFKDYRLREENFYGSEIYKRHAFTENGVSPLGVPGLTKHLIVTDSDEHDEEGHLIEDSLTRREMVNKRLFKKLPLIRDEIMPPLLYGDPSPEIVLIGWGSTYGVIREVVENLSKNLRIAMLHFSELFPFPNVLKFDYLKILKTAKTSICIENNATSQFARLLKVETGYSVTKTINKYDGRPFIVDELEEEVVKLITD